MKGGALAFAAALALAIFSSASLSHAEGTGLQAGAAPEGQGRQRLAYMALQVPLATALYGGGLPWALDAGSTKARIATPFLAAPLAFGAHLWFSQTRSFTSAHRQGTSYLSLAGLYAGFALPAAMIDPAGTRWRAAAWTSMATYPLGVYAGYLLGDAYQAEPDRIATQANYALGFGLLGFFTPLLYFDDFNGHQEDMWRIGLAQSVGLASLGHFISRYHQVGPQAAGGANWGIANHTALGMAGGLLTSAWCDASSVRPWLGGAVLGGTLGFMEGLWYFHDSRDTRERGIFSMVGGAAGGLAGFGLTLLLWDSEASGYQQRVTAASFLAGGAALGYVATYLLTQGMRESGKLSILGGRGASQARRGASREATPSWSWSIHPIPQVTPETVGEKIGEKTLWRYSFPGLVARF